MGLTSLYLFTLLGGAAAGTYVFETCFRRTREGQRPWLIAVVVVVLFAIGMAAAVTHLQSISHAFAALGAGTVNFGSGMVKEVLLAGCFLVLAAIDAVLVLAKKGTPFWLRAITAVVAVVAVVSMALAYTDIYGVTAWCDAPATILAFLGGDLAMGLALYVLLDGASYDVPALRGTSLGVNALFVVGLGLEIAAFMAGGVDYLSQAAGLVVAPLASMALVMLAPKIANKQSLAIAVCVLAIIGVAIARYGFYAAYVGA